jgi:SAM-dependent methyltransferase
MPCFKPLRNYLLKITNKLIIYYNIKGKFLEVGCGDGFLTEFLAKKGFSGKALDLSEEAVQLTRKRVERYQIVVQKQDIVSSEEIGTYDLIILLDVLEHIEKDQITIEKITQLLRKDSFIIVSVPIKKKEWRWDDENYGHYRRYEIQEIRNLFSHCGLQILVIWDITFPFIWALRRIYTRLLKPKQIVYRKEATKRSAFESSAGTGIMMKILERIPLWEFFFLIQDFFREKLYGCNVLILARRSSDKDSV